MTTLDGVMHIAAARLPDELADDDARAGLVAVARGLPAELVQGPLGLEIRLAGPRIVDAFAAAVPTTPGFRALAAKLSEPDVWTDADAAADLGQVLLRWDAGAGALPQVARYLLVEADAPATRDERLKVPSIFLAPRGNHDHWRPGMPPNAFQSRVDLTTMAAAELAGRWPDPQTAADFAAIVEQVPDEADVFAIGAMLSRSSGASMRVAARRLTAAQAHRVLAAAGLGSQADIIAALMEHTCAARCAIAFEVGPGAESRVGLELAATHAWERASHDGWADLLAEVVALGVADPARAAVVPDLIDADGDPLWGLAHVKVAASAEGLLPVSKLYVGLKHGGAPR